MSVQTDEEVLANSRDPGDWRPEYWLLKRLLPKLKRGRLNVVTPSDLHIEAACTTPGFQADVIIKRWRAIRRIILNGDLGFAEAYIDGDWTSSNLVDFLSFGADNMNDTSTGLLGLAPFRALRRFRHRSRANTKAGSRRNIAFHYDLGDDFYRPWLDQRMIYSSALYESPNQSLEDAQQAKIEKIISCLDLRGSLDVLEIGCGWGALAARMARDGHRVTGITLSARQHAYAQRVLKREGLDAHAEVKLQDYRDLSGQYDCVVSIEMMEAVGEAFWPIYFETIRKCLKPGGRAVLQVITIREDRFEEYRRDADFIQQHVFPGGMLPTKEIVISQARGVGLELLSLESFGESYRRTLAEWRRRFLATAPPDAGNPNGGPTFRRYWEYYLSYCEAGFRTNLTNVGIYTFLN